MTNTFHLCLPTTTLHTHLDCNPPYLQGIITAHHVVAQGDNGWLSELMTSIDTLPWTSCPGTHMLSVCNVIGGNDERERRVQPRDSARGDTPAELNTKLPAPSSSQCPTSQHYVANHSSTTCYATQRTTAVGYMIIWIGRSLRLRT